MKRSLQFGLLLLAAWCAPAQVLDRVAASVNNTPILLSQVDEAARFGAFLDGRNSASITDADRGAALARVIDQELVRQQIRRTEFVGAAEKPLSDVRSEIEEILLQQQVNQIFTSWLQGLRAEGRVRVLISFGPTHTATEQAAAPDGTPQSK